MTKSIHIEYGILLKWKYILVATAILEIVFQPLLYLHPANNQWLNDGSFSLVHSIEFLVVDQWLIECITTAIIFRIAYYYNRYLSLSELRTNFKQLSIYCIKQLPLVFFSFFVFNPFTQSVRYLYHSEGQWSSDVYFNEYFYGIDLYLAYLPFVFLLVYGILIFNILINYKIEIERKAKSSYSQKIYGYDDFGKVILNLDEIIWFERIGRKYFGFTQADKFRINDTLQDLEKRINSEKFIRINRSVIVNFNYVANYSYWKSDMYILRMKNGKEFTMTRSRLKTAQEKFHLV